MNLLFYSWFILVIAGFLLKRSRVVAALQTLCIFILSGWSCGNADYWSYVRDYDVYTFANLSSKEPLFILPQMWTHALDLTYQQFLIILSAVVLLVLFLLMRRFRVKDISYVLSLYMIFPFPMNVVTTRFTMASVYIIAAFIFASYEGKKYRVLSVVFCILALLTHFSCIVFLPLFLFSYDEEKSYNRKLLIITIAVAFIAITSYSIADLSSLVESQSFLKTVLTSVKNHQNGNNFVSVIYMMILEAAVCICALYQERMYDGKEGRLYDLVRKSNRILLLALAFTMMDQNFFRIQMLELVFQFIAMAKIYEEEGQTVKNSKAGLLMGAQPVMMLLNLVIFSDNIDTVLWPLFENNLLLGT